MKAKLKLLFFVALALNISLQIESSIQVENRTNKPIFVAVYCYPPVFFLNSKVTRQYEPIEIPARVKKKISRSGNIKCSSNLVFSYEKEELVPEISLAKAELMNFVGVGGISSGRAFNDFFIVDDNGKLRGYNNLTKEISAAANKGGEIVGAAIDTAIQYHPISLAARELMQMASVKLVFKDSILINSNPYKNKQARVRLGAQLNQSEQEYVKKRKMMAKGVLQNFLGQELNGRYVPTIATINSGGGTRSMISMLGFHIGLQNIKLLDAVTYDVGLSGGSWFVSLWQQSKKTLQAFKAELRSIVSLGIVGVDSKPFTVDENKLIAESFIVRAALEQPFTLVNIWGALIATRYLQPYGNKRQAILFSQLLSDNDAVQYPFPILTAISAYGYDVTPEQRVQMHWYEFTPYEVGGVGPWFKNMFVPTWAFGRRFENGVSQDYNPEYDLGLLMGIWGSIFGVTYSRIYQETKENLGILREPMRLIGSTLTDAAEIFQKDMHVSVAKIHNFTHGMKNSLYKEEKALQIADAGIAFNVPYPPVSGISARKADILIFFDASGGIINSGAQNLLLAERYARANNLKFPVLPRGEELIKQTTKSIAIFKDESDPTVPLVILFPAVADRSSITYDQSIPSGFSTDFSTIKFAYSAQEFNNLSLVTQQNIEQNIDKIKEAIRWKIAQSNGFVQTAR